MTDTTEVIQTSQVSGASKSIFDWVPYLPFWMALFTR